MTILFWLYKSRPNKKGECPIFTRITLDKRREQFSCNLWVDPKNWNQDKQRLRGRSAPSKAINQRLDQIEAELYAVRSVLSKTQDYVSARDIRSAYIEDKTSGIGILEAYEHHNKKMKALIGKEYVERTYLNFERNRKLLEGFIKKTFRRSDHYLEGMRRSFMEDFIFYLQTVKNHNPNTIHKHVQRVNKVVNYAVMNEWLDKNPFFGIKVKKLRKDITYLTTDELRHLEDREFEIKRLEVVRDLFLFQCYTGLAYQELRNLRYTDIQLGSDGHPWINAIRQKTRRSFRTPLLPKAMMVLEKHRDELAKPTDKVFKVSANSNMNAYLKEVGDLCGIKTPLTTHLGRKTFATTITLLNGVPISSVAQMLGHSDTRITEEVYAKVIDEKVTKDVAELRGKLDLDSLR